MKKIRKAILTGGGRATRLHPITTTINKHLIPLANKPMIFHAIEKAVEAGVKQIFINTNPGETSLQERIGDGAHWGVEIHYFEQPGGPQGIAHVVKSAQEFIGNDPFMFYLSDNVLLGSLGELFDAFERDNHDCMLALSEVPDPQRFGVPIFSAEGKLIDVQEKPSNPPNNFAVTGIYLYGPKVFFESFENIERSARGEYEISSIHSDFLKRGLSVGYKEITGWWKDTGKSEDMLLASELLLKHMKDDEFPKHGAVHDAADVSGNVHVGVGTDVRAGSKIIGPVIIGENCVIDKATIGPHVTIGSGCELHDVRIQNSIVLENTEIRVPISIEGSLIGKNAKLIPRDASTGEGHRMIIADKTIIEM